MTGCRKGSGIKFRALPVVAVVLTVTLVACKDDAPLPTGPTPSAPAASQLATGSVQSSDPLSSRLSSTPGACLVAVRSPDGKYRSRTVAVSLPKQIATSSAATSQFAYRGWAAAVPQPTILAWCNIPDSRSARTYFEKQFGGKSMNPAELRSFAQLIGVSGVEYWAAVGGPQIIQGAATTYVADGLASESPATKSAATGGVSPLLIPVCDPYADPPCDGSTPEEEYVPDTPPPPDGVVYDWWITPSPFPPPSYPQIECTIKTDNPHLSTHRYPFATYLNVIAWTGNCNVPASISARTVLGRQFCYFGNRLCQWFPIADPGYKSWYGTYVEATSSVFCTWAVGWYKGVSTHTLTAYGYTWTKQSPAEWIGIKCAV
jgi:hypothetical protein